MSKIKKYLLFVAVGFQLASNPFFAVTPKSDGSASQALADSSGKLAQSKTSNILNDPPASQSGQTKTSVIPTPSPQATKTIMPETITPSVSISPTSRQTPTPDITKHPTPTPTPVPHAATNRPPAGPVQFLTAPFALVVDMLPENVYSDKGLSKQTTTLLLSASAASIATGLLLLLLPALIRVKNRLISHFSKQNEFMPYLL